jgi:hypothetical protein
MRFVGLHFGGHASRYIAPGSSKDYGPCRGTPLGVRIGVHMEQGGAEASNYE